MKKKLLISSVWAVAMMMTLVYTPRVHAEDLVPAATGDASTDTAQVTAVVTSVPAPSPVVEVSTTTPLDGVTVSTPDKAPGAFGLWWRGIRERVSLALTLDPVKKAEKELQFAEERIQIAQKISQNSSDPQAQARAQDVINRANDFMGSIQAKKDELLKNPDERAQRLIRNIAIHTENSQAVLDRIAATLPADKQAAFNDIRQKVEDRGQQFLLQMNSSTLPDDIKAKLEQVRGRIEAVRQVQKDFRDGRRDVMREVRDNGGMTSTTMDELRGLRQDRRGELKDIRSSTRRDGNDDASSSMRLPPLRRERMEFRTTTLEDRLHMEDGSSTPGRGPGMMLPRDRRQGGEGDASSSEPTFMPLKELRRAKELPKKVDGHNEPIDEQLQQ